MLLELAQEGFMIPVHIRRTRPHACRIADSLSPFSWQAVNRVPT